MKRFCTACILGFMSAACVRSQPGPIPPTVVRVDTVVVSVAEIGESDDPEMRRGLEQARARGAERAALVDTIEVSPASIEMRVGEEVSFDRLQVTGRDKQGNVVDQFPPFFALGENSSVRFSGPAMQAIKPGKAVLYVEAVPRNPNTDPLPRRPFTQVPISVRP